MSNWSIGQTERTSIPPSQRRLRPSWQLSFSIWLFLGWNWLFSLSYGLTSKPYTNHAHMSPHLSTQISCVIKSTSSIFFSGRKRIKPLSHSRFAWPFALFRADYRAIILANGLDAYFFVRFLRVMTFTFLPIWFISWAVLLPVNSVKSFSGNSGLDLFTFGNVATTKQVRHAAHLILVYVFTCELY